MLDRALDLTEPFAQINMMLIAHADENFNMAGRREKWTELAPATLLEKYKLGYSMDPLIRTGMLRGSIVGTAGPDFAKLEYKDWKAKFHDYGTKRIPARPLIQEGEEDINDYVEILTDYIVEG